jgi:Cu/Ag efflux protein CusF
MNRFLIALAGTLLTAGCSTSTTPKADTPPDPLNITNSVQASATVTKIDVATRTLTLKTDSVEEIPLEASAAVRNLPQVKVGDRVTVTYFEAIGATMRKPGDSTDATVDLGAGRTEAGQRPGGVVATVQTLPVTIVSVDTKASTVKFYAADKQVRTITVKRPESKAYIARLKVGDEVIVTYSEAVAIEVKPAQ